MAYVRKKTVKGHDYYYLVKGVRTGRRVQQIVLRYLGPEKPSAGEVDRLKREQDAEDRGKKHKERT